MILKTYFDKNNTIVFNETINTARNPVTELFYGGSDHENKYSRYLFHFDVNRLKSLYTGGTYTDLSKLTHTLKLTNTATFDETLVNGTYQSKERATSFDLIVFKISQDWDEGVGYDYNTSGLLYGNCSISTKASNWINAQTGVNWNNGSGVYSGTPSGITINTQHFDIGNENIEIDITSYVNGLLTGDTNYGLGLSYLRPYELTETNELQYVGFFTRNTQTFYEPFVETIYDNHITDDRHNFYLDKPNKLYLYVNLAGNPTNLDSNPSLNIYDENDNLYSSYTPSQVTHVTKGVYSVDILIETQTEYLNSLFKDVWSDISINSITRPDISLRFETKDSLGYYNIGDDDALPKKVAVTISGIQNQEKIKSGDIRKVIVSTRIPYIVEQTQSIFNLKYRLYVKEGKNELTVIDYQPVEQLANSNYFLIDTESLLPNTYYVDILSESNLELTTTKNVTSFIIINESNQRNGQ